jgi:hypothetical protein
MNFLQFDGDGNYTRAGKANETERIRGQKIFLRQAHNHAGAPNVTAILNPGEKPVRS